MKNKARDDMTMSFLVWLSTRRTEYYAVARITIEQWIWRSMPDASEKQTATTLSRLVSAAEKAGMLERESKTTWLLLSGMVPATEIVAGLSGAPDPVSKMMRWGMPHDTALDLCFVLADVGVFASFQYGGGVTRVAYKAA